LAHLESMVGKAHSVKPDPRVPAALFARYGFDGARFVRSDRKSVRGPCPICGGKRRMVVFLDRPNPNFECLCGYTGFMDDKSLTPDALAELKANAERAARERERERLAEFTTAELWQECHRRLGEEQRAWWTAQGIPPDWQNFYQLGYTPDRLFVGDAGPFHRPAYTIPIFAEGWQAVNTQYRIVDPPPGCGKYRQEPGLPAAAFLSRPDLPLPDSMIVVEGAKKAAVLCARLPKSPQIAGLPGARSWAGLDERLAECGRVWVMLDPDAREAAYALARSIGPAARVVETPCKPDDWTLRYGATPEHFRAAFRYAKPVR
jgi:hypothetical protein